METCATKVIIVADPGEGPTLFWVKKEEITKDRKVGRPHLAQGLDPPLGYTDEL